MDGFFDVLCFIYLLCYVEDLVVIVCELVWVVCFGGWVVNFEFAVLVNLLWWVVWFGYMCVVLLVVGLLIGGWEWY